MQMRSCGKTACSKYPDFLANAGGVTCSYFETGSIKHELLLGKSKKVLHKLDYQMTTSFKAVKETADKNKLYMRGSAYVISINRVAQAVKMPRLGITKRIINNVT
jgi:glutamate dehydrogenase (NAD(P)+)